jgi:hypothetical protein
MAAELSNRAFTLGEAVRLQKTSGLHVDGMNEMKAEVNKIGIGLRTLEAERAVLAPWEARLLDRVEPLMHDVAENVTAGIHEVNLHSGELWFTPYAAETATITKDADQVASLIKDSIRLNKDRHEARRLEQKLMEAGSN